MTTPISSAAALTTIQQVIGADSSTTTPASVNPQELSGIDFGPAAVFTPSQQLLNLQSSQQASLLSALGAGPAYAGLNSFTQTAFSQAAQYNIYNSAGVAVPLAQTLTNGVPAVAQFTTDPALNQDTGTQS
ncbi:MAG TPA: hypothetical protein VJT31_39750 [Rugosimonospora sp.]|nr:hypothetical protein [Rugosimonospora sp.]